MDGINKNVTQGRDPLQKIRGRLLLMFPIAIIVYTLEWKDINSYANFCGNVDDCLIIKKLSY